MMEKIRLGDIAATITKGTTPTTIGFPFVDTGINFVKIESIDEAGNFLPDRFAHITDECNRKLGRSKLEENDILFSIAGAIGRTAIVPKSILPANTNQALAIIRIPSDAINLQFVLYALQSQAVAEQSEKQKQGVAQLNLSLKNIADIQIPFVSSEKQAEIVRILAALDVAIRQRKEQIKFIDQLVKSRFIELFGVYPSNPKGWETATIRDIVADVRYGSSRPAVDGGKYPYLRMNNITYGGELDLTDTKRIDIPDNELDKCTVRRGDVLFNRTNSKELVGKTCVYNRDEMMVLAGFVIRVRVTERVLPEFLSAFLNTDFSKQMLLGMCKAAIGQANINAQEMQNIGIYLPPTELQRQFVQFKKQTDKSKYYKSIQILKLITEAIAKEVSHDRIR